MVVEGNIFLIFKKNKPFFISSSCINFLIYCEICIIHRFQSCILFSSLLRLCVLSEPNLSYSSVIHFPKPISLPLHPSLALRPLNHFPQKTSSISFTASLKLFFAYLLLSLSVFLHLFLYHLVSHLSSVNILFIPISLLFMSLLMLPNPGSF